MYVVVALRGLRCHSHHDDDPPAFDDPTAAIILPPTSSAPASPLGPGLRLFGSKTASPPTRIHLTVSLSTPTDPTRSTFVYLAVFRSDLTFSVPGTGQPCEDPHLPPWSEILACASPRTKSPQLEGATHLGREMARDCLGPILVPEQDDMANRHDGNSQGEEEEEEKEKGGEEDDLRRRPRPRWVHAVLTGTRRPLLAREEYTVCVVPKTFVSSEPAPLTYMHYADIEGVGPMECASILLGVAETPIWSDDGVILPRGSSTSTNNADDDQPLPTPLVPPPRFEVRIRGSSVAAAVEVGLILRPNEYPDPSIYVSSTTDDPLDADGLAPSSTSTSSTTTTTTITTTTSPSPSLHVVGGVQMSLMVVPYVPGRVFGRPTADEVRRCARRAPDLSPPPTASPTHIPAACWRSSHHADPDMDQTPAALAITETWSIDPRWSGGRMMGEVVQEAIGVAGWQLVVANLAWRQTYAVCATLDTYRTVDGTPGNYILDHVECRVRRGHDQKE